jgi:hypothetical protein
MDDSVTVLPYEPRPEPPRPLGKLLQRGERVTVALRGGEVVKAVVQGGRREIRVRFTRHEVRAAGGPSEAIRLGAVVVLKKRRVTYRIERAAEGIEWVRGWEGETTDAFRAFVVLST